MNYNYFIPLIHFGPVHGSQFVQKLPLESIQKLIVGKVAKFQIVRKVISDNKLILEKEEIIEFLNNKWMNKEAAYFQWKSNIRKNQLCYIETHVNLLKGKGLLSSSMPGFYVNYLHQKRKNFISCGLDKYGNPRVILQMKEFGMWIDGYPGININKENNTTYSLIIINPYKTQALMTLEIKNKKIAHSFKVSASSVKKIDLKEIIKQDFWTGQLYVYGKRRSLVYLVNHAINNFVDISTIEHSDPFRAEYTYQPRFQFFRNLIHKKLKSILKKK